MGVEAAVRVLERYEGAFDANVAEGMNALFRENSTFVNFSGSAAGDRKELLGKQRFAFGEGGPLRESERRIRTGQNTPVSVG